MKRLLISLLCVVMVVCFMPTMAFADEPGVVGPTVVADYSWYTGTTEGTEYTISNAEQLVGLANIVNGTDGQTADTFFGKTVKLGADIDLSGIEWTPIGNSISPVKSFNGEFDGNGKTISNLKQTELSGDSMGLFGRTDTKAYLHNFTLKDVTLSATGSSLRISALAARTYRTVMKDVIIDGVNITVNGTSSGSMVCGAVARLEQSQLDNVDVRNANFTVNDTSCYVGGIYACSIAHSWNDNRNNNDHWIDGTIFSYDDTKYGVLQNFFKDCDVADIKINVSGSGTAGGFGGNVNFNAGTHYCQNCTVSGLDMTCTGEFDAGGFLGTNSGSTYANLKNTIPEAYWDGFQNCSAQGKITGDTGNYGGFFGYLGGWNKTISSASADVDVTSNARSGGFVGGIETYATQPYTFENCTAEGNVSGSVSGGFLGEIAHSDATGSVPAGSLNATFDNCSAEGNVTGDTAGGFLGKVDPNNRLSGGSSSDGNITLSECSANGIVTGKDYAGGMIGDVTDTTDEKGISQNTIVNVSGTVSSTVIGMQNTTKVSGTVNKTEDDANIDSVSNLTDSGTTIVPPADNTITVNVDGSLSIPAGSTITEKKADGTTESKSVENESVLTQEGAVSPKATSETISLNKNQLSLYVGSEETLAATVEPTDAAVIWTSSNPSVASVDQTGKVTANKAGTATITVSAVGTNLTASCMITVTSPSTYIPTNQKPTIVADENAKVTLSADGTKATIAAADGYELADVILNGVSQGKVTEVKGLKTGDKLVVTVVKTSQEPTKEEILAALADQQLVARSKVVTLKNGKKAILITWYNSKGEMMEFDGVEIFRSTKKSSGYGKKPVFTSETGKYYNTSIKSGTRYYYRVRGYVVIDGEKYYTDWSLKAIRTA